MDFYGVSAYILSKDHKPREANILFLMIRLN